MSTKFQGVQDVLLSPKEGSARLGTHRGRLVVSLECVSTVFQEATEATK